MPFGLRYIARELYRSLRTQYPGESDDDAIRLVGRFVYYRFIQPAIMFGPLLLSRFIVSSTDSSVM